MLPVSRPELRHPLGVRRDGHEVLGDRGLVLAGQACNPAPGGVVNVSRVVNVFDDTMNSVSSADEFLVASTKSVESTLETNRNVRCARSSGSRLVGHYRLGRNTDADVDDVANRPAGMAFPFTNGCWWRTRPSGPRRHALGRPRRPRRPSAYWRLSAYTSATCRTARFSGHVDRLSRRTSSRGAPRDRTAGPTRLADRRFHR